MWMRLRAVNVFSLYSTTRSPATKPWVICKRPSRSERPV